MRSIFTLFCELCSSCNCLVVFVGIVFNCKISADIELLFVHIFSLSVIWDYTTIIPDMSIHKINYFCACCWLYCIRAAIFCSLVWSLYFLTLTIKVVESIAFLFFPNILPRFLSGIIYHIIPEVKNYFCACCWLYFILAAILSSLVLVLFLRLAK